VRDGGGGGGGGERDGGREGERESERVTCIQDGEVRGRADQ
jgi:hypothetical protein